MEDGFSALKSSGFAPSLCAPSRLGVFAVSKWVATLPRLTRWYEPRMATRTSEALRLVAKELHITEDDVLRQALRAFLETELRAVKAQVCEITGLYGVSSSTEMDTRYQNGTLEEADTWRDLQRLDHLEASTFSMGF